MPYIHSSRAITRRTALQLASSACITAVLPAAVIAADLPHLEVNDPKAVALGYVENVSKIDPKKFPSYAQGQQCENCLQLQGAAGAAYRPCDLFPGKLVAVAGWCSGWTAEI